MSYTINTRVVDDTGDALVIVEKTVWNYANGGTWTDFVDGHTLTMGGSGTSGLLRFISSSGEKFIVAFGVHNYKRWTDILPDLTNSQTATVLHPTYYSDGPNAKVREQQLSNISKTTSSGKKITVDFYNNVGNTFYSTVTIG